MMRLSYEVTFEFDTRAPVTHRGAVKATSAAAACARAIREAKKILKPHSWTSMVCVLLDRTIEGSGEEQPAELVEVEG